MPQQSGNVGWSVDTLDEEARAMQQRLSDLTADGRMNHSEAMRQIQREDNAQLVQMNIEKAAQDRARNRPPEAPAPDKQPEQEQLAPPAQQRTLIFSEDREPHVLNLNLQKKEQADLSPAPAQPGEGRTLTFSEDREGRSPDYNALKRETAQATPAQGKGEGRTLSFAEDHSRGHDLSR